MCRDTACSHPNAFEGFTLVAGQTQTWVILAKINRSPGFKKTEGNPARETFQRIARFFNGQLCMSWQDLGGLGRGPLLQPLARSFTLGRVDFGCADNLDARRHPARSLGQMGHGRIDVFDLAFIIQFERIIRRRHDQRQAFQDQRAHSGLGCAAHRLAFERTGIKNRFEGQAFQASNDMAFHTDITFRGQFGHEGVFLLQAGKQSGGSPVHEPGSQRFV